MAQEGNTGIDFNALPDEQLQTIIESGGQIPEALAEAPAVEETAPAAEEPAIEAEVVEDAPAATEIPLPEAAPESDDIVTLEKRVNEFSFTENAPAETLMAEEAQYLEMVELPAPVTAMITRRDAEIEQLSKIQPLDDDAARHMTAFNHLAAEYVQTEEGWVPDTAPARELLLKTYPKEFDQLISDHLSERSTKYPTFSRMHELIMDEFGLSEQQMETLDLVLQNGGNFPRPSYLPEGVDRKYIDAYWYSPEREEISEQIERNIAIWRDKDSLETERLAAKQSLINVNQKLAREQRMIDAEREKFLKERQVPIDNEAYAREHGTVAYEKTVVDFIEASSGDLEKQLAPIVGDTAAKADAAAFSQLLINAFSDADTFAKLAQRQIESLGIKVEWPKVAQIINKIFQTECKLKYLEKVNANERAVNLEKQNKLNLLRDLTAYEKSVKGQFVALKVKDSGEAVKRKVAAVPVVKKTAVVKPKTLGTAPTQKENLEAWLNDPKTSPDDIEKWANRYMAEQRKA
jgi:hypothetical protein